MQRITTYVFWFLLALPGIWLVTQQYVLHQKTALLTWSGLISCWLLIATMMVTPLQYLFGRLPWLKEHRRHLGVASFAYATLHLVDWLLGINIGALIRSFYRVEILTGWIGFFIMIPLAITSNDLSVRAMGRSWKPLQRWVYLAAVMSFVHWIMTTGNRVEAVLYCVPLAVLSIWRILRYQSRLRGA